MQITSTAFQNNEFIPVEYSCKDVNMNPPLTLSKVPKEAQSLVLLMEDKDDPASKTHWLMYNIPSSTLQILPATKPPTSMLGMNDFGDATYHGPCPTPTIHRYVFTLIALKKILPLAEHATKDKVKQAINNSIIALCEITGKYGKSGKKQ